MGISIRRLSATAGAEISGVDFTQPLAAATVKPIHQALGENCVLLFRGANITPEQHIAFSRHFGPLEAHVIGVFIRRAPAYPGTVHCVPV